MEAERTTGPRTRAGSQGSARGSKKGSAALAMAAAGALGGIALSRRRRAASANEPLEAGALPEVEQASGLQHARQPVPGRATP